MSKSKSKTPFALKAIRTIYPWLERVAPFLAYRYFIRLFFSPIRYAIPEKEKEIAAKAETFSFQVEEKRIQAYKWGQGPIVLFVHGWAGRATQFRKFIEAFTSKGFQAIAFDGPAHGMSQGKKTQIIEFETTLKELFKMLPQRPVAVITHSFGGAATLYAIMNGLPVKRLINIASPAIGDEIINTYLKAINGTWKSGNYFKDFMVRTYGKTFDEFSSVYFIKHLPNPLDLLLIYDENDSEVTPAHAEELIKLYPSAKLMRTRGLGHTRILKDDHVIEDCLRFISQPL